MVVFYFDDRFHQHIHVTYFFFVTFVMSGICTNFVHLTKRHNNQKMGAQKHHWGKFFFPTSLKKHAYNTFYYFYFCFWAWSILIEFRELLVMNSVTCVCLVIIIKVDKKITILTMSLQIEQAIEAGCQVMATCDWKNLH